MNCRLRFYTSFKPGITNICSSFDFARDIHLLDDWSGLADAKDLALSEFREKGGKLLMTHGWADSILQPTLSVNY